jgi:hypothetical protein
MRTFTSLGYTLSPTSGVIDGIRVHDAAKRYLFAWHRNHHHLLFYLRMPALQARRGLHELAVANQPDGRATQNNGGETTIRLCSDAEVQTLLDWLLPLLPLPR